jgi:hypothetical protein
LQGLFQIGKARPAQKPILKDTDAADPFIDDQNSGAPSLKEQRGFHPGYSGP